MKVPLSPWAIATAVVMTASASSAQGVVREQQTTSLGLTTTLRQPGTIIGTAWHSDNTPIANALLRLRNIVSGQVVMGTQADIAGRFTFAHVAPGSYIVELVDDGGTIKALGQTFSMAHGETVATFIRLGARLPWYSGFFSNASAAALASAASLGVTAVGPGGQPASARF